MRFDLLDEYSTLVPFGHVSKHSGAIQAPDTATRMAKPGVIPNCVNRLKIFCRFAKAAGSSWEARSAKRTSEPSTPG